MELPDKVSLQQVSPTMVQVSGWASEPFVMTEDSARRNLERVRSRRSSYASPAEYERHLSVPVEVMKMMGWEIPEDKNAVPEPQTAPQTQSEVIKPLDSAHPEPQAAPQTEPEPPPVQTGQFMSQVYPVEPTPSKPQQDEPGASKTWVEKMIEDQAMA